MQFTDANGNPSAISKELLGIAERALPSVIQDLVEYVEPNHQGGGTTPKGVGRGWIEYKTIYLSIPEPVGDLVIGIRKNTSGPGTGYILLDSDLFGDDLRDGVAAEFYDGWSYSLDASEALKKLFDEYVAPHVPQLRGAVTGKKMGIIESYDSFLKRISE